MYLTISVASQYLILDKVLTLFTSLKNLYKGQFLSEALWLLSQFAEQLSFLHIVIVSWLDPMFTHFALDLQLLLVCPNFWQLKHLRKLMLILPEILFLKVILIESESTN